MLSRIYKSMKFGRFSRMSPQGKQPQQKVMKTSNYLKNHLFHEIQQKYLHINKHFQLSDNVSSILQRHIDQIMHNLRIIRHKADENLAQKQYDINLYYQPTPQNQYIISKLNHLKDKTYVPTPYMQHSFLQSLYNIRYSRTDKVQMHRELVKFSDGGQISLDWALPTFKQVSQDPNSKPIYVEYEPPEDTKILFVVHGLTGGSNMNYVKYLLKMAQRQGFRAVAFNSRGINTDLTTPIPFNGQDLGDLDYTLRYIKQKYPKASIFGVGCSYGANMLIRWAGELKEQCFLKALIGLATPFDIKKCIDEMGPVYEKFFVNRYKANIIDPHMNMLKKLEQSHGVDFNKVQNCKTLCEFHETITVKVFNYKNAEEYFDKSNVKDKHILGLTIPSLLIYSKDDPIVTSKCVPVKTLQQNKNIITAETSHGAHVCWYSGLKPKRWYPKPTLQYCNIILSMDKKRLQENTTLNTYSKQ